MSLGSVRAGPAGGARALGPRGSGNWMATRTVARAAFHREPCPPRVAPIVLTGSTLPRACVPTNDSLISCPRRRRFSLP